MLPLNRPCVRTVYGETECKGNIATPLKQKWNIVGSVASHLTQPYMIVT